MFLGLESRLKHIIWGKKKIDDRYGVSNIVLSSYDCQIVSHYPLLTL